jgi:hypothetical protein
VELLFRGMIWMGKMFLSNLSVEVGIYGWSVRDIDYESMKCFSERSQTIWQGSMQNQVAYV